MSQQLQRLIEGAILPTGAASFYTAPGGTFTGITAMTLCNFSGGAQTATIYLVQAGGAVGNASTLEKTLAVPAGATVSVTDAIGHVLAPGDSIQALASAGNAITLMASGIEQVPS